MFQTGSDIFIHTPLYSHSPLLRWSSQAYEMSCSYHLHIPLITSLSIPLTTPNPVKIPLRCHPPISTLKCRLRTYKERRRKQRFQASTSNSRESEDTSTATDENIHGKVEQEKISKATLIWRAVKLPIYSVALVPLTVGSAAGYMQAGVFSAKRFFVLLASSILVITWLNLSNDVYDFDTGADKNKKESVVNMVGSRTGTLISAYTLLVIGFIGLTWTCAQAGNIRSILLLTCAIICGYIYQCPPFRLSYKGLGEPLCFAAFGPFATTAFYLLQSNQSEITQLPLSGTILSASFLVGFTTSLILLCSHFHQVDGDLAVGKMSPLVRIGTKSGSQVVKISVMSLYFLLVALGLSRSLPITCIFFCALTLPVGRSIVRFVEENHTNTSKIFMAKYYCVRLHALFGTALSIGLIAARIMAKPYVSRPLSL